MNSGQGVLWIILWICLNSELLRYHGVQNFAKTIQKMQNSLTLRQQHFLCQRKNLYDQESSRSSSGEIVPENLHENLQPEFFIFSLHRTLSEVAALPRVKLGIPVGRAPVGTIAI